MTGPIYQPKGHAAPYAKLALNPYRTCSIRCSFCYNAVRNPHFFSDVPLILRGSADKLLAELERQCATWAGEKWPVHMTFLGDCYQPAEEELGLTRRCIEMLHWHGFPVQILTKATELPARDFDLLTEPEDMLGVTLTGPNPARVALLRLAHSRGILTWVSLEPVLDYDSAAVVLAAIRESQVLPCPIWIGPLNHKTRTYDWPEVKARLKAEAGALALLPLVRWKDEA